MAFISTYEMHNSTILRVTSEIDSIEMSPEYQRRGDIWTLDKRQLFIDSILNDYDIPKLYFYVLSKGEKNQYAIIDGRQRLETILSFRSGKFALSKDFKYLKDPSLQLGGLTYADLVKEHNKLAIIFDSCVLPIICVETNDMELIEEMFSRLNEAVPLNAAEKRNAFGGSMVKTITKVSNHEFFQRKVRFTNKRYQHREVSARLLFIEDSILNNNRLYDTKKPYLDGMVKKFKQNRNLSPNNIESKVETVLDGMLDIFIDKDPLLGSQSIMPVYYLLIKTARDQGKDNVITHSKLVEFRDAVANNRAIAEEDITQADFDLLAFDRMSVQGTNDAVSINERVRIIGSYFEIDVPHFLYLSASEVHKV